MTISNRPNGSVIPFLLRFARPLHSSTTPAAPVENSLAQGTAPDTRFTKVAAETTDDE